MDLSTTYLGFELPNPFIVGASPLADNVDNVKKLVDAGASAIVLRSLFEEQLTSEGLATTASMDGVADSFAEALSYFANPEHFVLGPDEYVSHLQEVKEVAGVPVIASLNGTTSGGWLNHAKRLEEAGADALELHIYSVPTDPDVSGRTIVDNTTEMVGQVKSAVRIPVAVKLSPFYASFANVAKRLDEKSVDGIVVFNRFYQPDIDVEELEVTKALRLSDSSDLPLRLRGLAVISGRVKASLAVTGGVHTCVDAVKASMCGAHAIQLVSALLKNGPEHISRLRDELAEWLEKHEYQSLRQMQGSMSLQKCPNPRAFIRGSYAQVLQTWTVE